MLEQPPLCPAIAGAARGHAGVDTIDGLAALRRDRRRLLSSVRSALAARKARAAAWVVELDPMLVASGPFELHQELLEAALPLAPVESGVRSDVLRALGRLFTVRGVHALAVRALDDALACAPEGPRRSAVLAVRAYALTGLERWPEAQRAVDEARAAALEVERTGERLRLRAFVAQVAALGASQRGEGADARAGLEETLDLARQAGADRMVALAHANLAAVAGEPGRAHAHLAAARALFVALDDRLHLGRVDLALAQLGAGPLPLEEVARRAEALRDYQGAATARLTLFEAALDRGDRLRARSHLDGAWRALAQCDAPLLSLRCTDAEVRLGAATRVLRLDLRRRSFTLDGEAVDLARRSALPRLLQALASAPAGASLTVEALFAAGWPGERALPAAAASRVYVAVRTLRRLGLGAVLETTGDGYRLAPDVRIEVD